MKQNKWKYIGEFLVKLDSLHKSLALFDLNENKSS